MGYWNCSVELPFRRATVFVPFLYFTRIRRNILISEIKLRRRVYNFDDAYAPDVPFGRLIRKLCAPTALHPLIIIVFTVRLPTLSPAGVEAGRGFAAGHLENMIFK